MKKQTILFLLLGLFAAVSFGQTIRSKTSKVNFSISNMNVNTVDGTITGLNGTLDFDREQPEAGKFDVSINAGTINTDNESRDKHLRSEDFFEVEKYPKITFVSTSIRKDKGDNNYVTDGKLTIRDVTKNVTIPFHITETNETLYFIGNFKINRKDFNVGPSGTFMVGDEVTIEIVCVVEPE